MLYLGCHRRHFNKITDSTVTTEYTSTSFSLMLELLEIETK